MARDPNVDKLIAALATPPDPEPVPRVQASDYLKQLGSGALQAVGYGVQGAGEAVNAPSVGNGQQPVVDATPLMDIGRSIAAKGTDLSNSVSPTARERMASSTPDGKFTDPKSWTLGTDPSVSGYALQAANVLGQVAPVAATAIATKGRLLPTSGVAAALGGGAAAGQEEDRINQMDAADLAKVPAYQQAIARGMTPDAARATLAQKAGATSFAQTAPVSALSGLTEGLPITGQFQNALGKVVGTSRLARAGVGGLTDAIAEGSQEALENAAEISGANTATGEDRSLQEGGLQNAVLGAVGGAVVGTTGGLIHNGHGAHGESVPGNEVPAAGAAPAQADEAVAPPQAKPAAVTPGYKAGAVNPLDGTVNVAPGVNLNPNDGPLSKAVSTGAINGDMDRPAMVTMDDGAVVHAGTGEVLAPASENLAGQREDEAKANEKTEKVADDAAKAAAKADTAPSPSSTESSAGLDLALDDVPGTPPANAPASPTASSDASASVPFFITMAQRAELRGRGIDNDAIRKMTPSQAQDILAQPAPPAAANSQSAAAHAPATQQDIDAAVADAYGKQGVLDAQATNALAKRLGVQPAEVSEAKKRISGSVSPSPETVSETTYPTTIAANRARRGMANPDTFEVVSTGPKAYELRPVGAAETTTQEQTHGNEEAQPIRREGSQPLGTDAGENAQVNEQLAGAPGGQEGGPGASAVAPQSVRGEVGSTEPGSVGGGNPGNAIAADGEAGQRSSGTGNAEPDAGRGTGAAEAADSGRAVENGRQGEAVADGGTRGENAVEQAHVLNESGEQLDSDITTPSGSPFTIRDAADKAAKRHPGHSVVELEDGGFVVREGVRNEQAPATESIRGTEGVTPGADTAAHISGSEEVRGPDDAGRAGSEATTANGAVDSGDVPGRHDGGNTVVDEKAGEPSAASDGASTGSEAAGVATTQEDALAKARNGTPLAPKEQRLLARRKVIEKLDAAKLYSDISGASKSAATKAINAMETAKDRTGAVLKTGLRDVNAVIEAAQKAIKGEPSAENTAAKVPAKEAKTFHTQGAADAYLDKFNRREKLSFVRTESGNYEVHPIEAVTAAREAYEAGTVTQEGLHDFLASYPDSAQSGDRRVATEQRTAIDALPAGESEVEKLRARVADLERERTTSDITGLRNKKAFDDDAKLGWSHVGAADMDGLKALNDTIGHEAADTVLKALGTHLKGLEGDDVRFYHRSGDEFAARFKDAETAERTMRDVQSALDSVRIELTDGNTQLVYDGIGLSVGHGDTYEQADTAVNADKADRLASGKRQSPRENGAPGRLRKADAEGLQANAGNAVGREAVPEAGHAQGLAEDRANQGALFSKSPATDTDTPRRTLAPERVRSQVERIAAKWKNGPVIQVVDTAADLPARIRNAPGFDATVEAAHDNGAIYIVADRFASPARVQQVLAHEAIGHYGVEQILGRSGFANVRDQIVAMRDAGRLKDVFAEVDSRYGTLDNATLAAETMAVMAERGLRTPLLGKALSALRDFLRKLGFNITFNEGDLRQILANAGKWLETGRARPLVSVQDSPSFASGEARAAEAESTDSPFGEGFWAGVDNRGDSNVVADARRQWAEKGTDSPYFKQWFGDSKATTKAGKPVTFYHATNGDFSVFDTTKAGSSTNYAASGLGIFMTPNESTASRYGDNVMQLYVRAEKPYRMGVEELANFDSVGDARKRQQELVAQGYDSIFVPADKTLIAFGPDQVKSATSNRGTFSQATPDINFSKYQSPTNEQAEAFRDMTKEQFLGKPTITKNDNASALKPSIGFYEENQPKEPFMGGQYEAQFAPEGAVVIDGKKPIASYGFGDTLVVDKKYRRQGIGEELVYQWRTRYPAEAVAKTRTRASQALQEKVWDRIQGDLARNDAAVSFSKNPAAALDNDIEKAAKFKVTDIVQTMRDKREDWRPNWLGMLTLRQLGEVAEPYLPKIAAYNDTVQTMQTRRNQLQEQAAHTADKWWQWQRKNREQSKAMAEVMHDATMAGVDPAEPFKSGSVTLAGGVTVPMNNYAVTKEIRNLASKMEGAPETVKNLLKADIKRLEETLAQEEGRRQAYPELKQRYDAMPEAAKAIYAEVRDSYTQRADDMQEALVKRIAGLEMGEAGRKDLTDRIRAHFESARVQAPYFPLARFGEYWVSAEKDGEKQFRMMESRSQQRRVQNAYAKEGWTVKAGAKIDMLQAVDGASASFMANVTEKLNEANVDKDVTDEIYQLYLRTLPDLSVRKQFIHRKGTAGYDADALRAFAGQMNHGAYQLARLENSQVMETLLRGMRKDVDALTAGGGVEAVKAARAMSEVDKRHQWVMNPKDSAWVQRVSSANFAYYLGATPAAALINVLQGAMTTFPALAARHGWVKALTALTGATNQSIRTYGNIEKTLKNADERAAYQQLLSMGAIDRTLSHDLAGMGEGSLLAYNPAWRNTMSVLSHLFHKAEVFNREGAGLAAYRLSREAGETHEAAVKYAADTIFQTHFDYSNANRARFMQGNAAKVLFAFKQYSQSMTYYLWRNFYQATRGATPEAKAEARKKLVGTLGMTAVFSGVMGMPLMTLTMQIANAMASMFGDDDEPWDAETEFRNFLSDHLGPTWGNIAQNGPVQSLTGLGIADRTKLDQMWFRPSDKELEGRAQYDYLLEQVAGPIGGMFANGYRASQLYADGQIWRGVETAMPKAIRDAMKTIRYGQEGVRTLSGDPLVPDLSPYQMAMQAAGFSPAKVSEMYEANNAMKGYEQTTKKRRQSLLDAYAMATTTRDTDAIRAATEAIERFNSKNPDAVINGGTIRRSLQGKAKYSQRMVDGLVLDPKMEARIRNSVRFGGDSDDGGDDD